MNMKQARAMRAAMVKGCAGLDDQTASTAPMLFETLTGSGETVESGARIRWNGQLKRAVVTLWDREDQNPENAPELWEDIAYVDGVRRIPETITAGQAFAKGELGWWKGEILESLMDGNVWPPEVYADGWKKQT